MRGPVPTLPVPPKSLPLRHEAASPPKMGKSIKTFLFTFFLSFWILLMTSHATPSSSISWEGVTSSSTNSSPSASAQYLLERAGSTVYEIWHKEIGNTEVSFSRFSRLMLLNPRMRPFKVLSNIALRKFSYQDIFSNKDTSNQDTSYQDVSYRDTSLIKTFFCVPLLYCDYPLKRSGHFSNQDTPLTFM